VQHLALMGVWGLTSSLRQVCANSAVSVLQSTVKVGQGPLVVISMPTVMT
jgi:hypothetical protein